MSRYRVSMDIGGTFTDVVAYDEEQRDVPRGQVVDDAEATSPRASSRRSAPSSTRPPRSAFTVHGTTQGLNAFLQRRGERCCCWRRAAPATSTTSPAATALRLYDIHYRKPTPLVPAQRHRRDRRPARTGRARSSSRWTRTPSAPRRGARGRRASAPSPSRFLFSYVNPAHELRAEEILLEELDGDHRLPLAPRRARVARVRAHLVGGHRRLHRAGRAPLPRAARERAAAPRAVRAAARDAVVRRHRHGRSRRASCSLQTLLSGPVGGTMGGVALARMLDRPNLICIDMGGTSFDVSLVVDGKPDVVVRDDARGLPAPDVGRQHPHDRRRRRLARLRRGGRPARRAGERRRRPRPRLLRPRRHDGRPSPTRTSSLGRIDPAVLRRRPDDARRRRGRAGARRRSATSSASRPIELAEGICDVINAKMAQAIRTLTVEKGIEPRDFALVAFGGAGPMHAVFLARELEIARGRSSRRFPGAFSAWGMLETEIRKDLGARLLHSARGARSRRPRRDARASSRRRLRRLARGGGHRAATPAAWSMRSTSATSVRSTP